MDILIKACMNGNLGDDLFVLTILERYKNLENCHYDILVYEHKKYRYLENKYSNVSLIKYPVPSLAQRLKIKLEKQKTGDKKKYYSEVYKKALGKRYDVFLNVGGSLMSEYVGGGRLCIK